MKQLRLFILSFIVPLTGALLCTSANAQLGQWTWIAGDTTVNSPGHIGQIGIPSPLNEPEPRYACGNWTDTGGNFWIYSGLSANADLWKFDVSLGEWIWMNGDDSTFNPDPEFAPGVNQGQYDALNSPGQLGYGMLTWTTPNNHLWLYGGLLNTAAGPQQFAKISANLWQYDPAINQWAFMGKFGSDINGVSNGPVWGNKGIPDTANKPGGRQEGNTTWVDDDGNLWFFGGCDVDLRSYNDLWKYDVPSGIWTWMSGSKTADDTVGSYGIIGQPYDKNYPTARSTNFFWKDTAGNFWLSGGSQVNPEPRGRFYQDTWEFNPHNLNWTWVNGPRGEDTTSFGVACTLDSTNKYGAHYENRATWKHCDDLIITYNGFDNWNGGQPNQHNLQNDMWGFKISTDEWVKINDWTYTGVWGTQGVASPSNYPYSRAGAVGFTAKDGSLWLFGGYANTLGNAANFFNDLWKYVIDTNCITCKRECHIINPVITSNKDTICAADSAIICAPVNYTTYVWNYNGATTNCVAVKQAGDYSVTVTESNGCSAQSATVHVAVYPVLPVTITQVVDTMITRGKVNAWYRNGTVIEGATSDTLISSVSGVYTVSVIDINGCPALSSAVTVGIPELDFTKFISIFPNPNSTGAWQLSVDNSLVGSKLEIYDVNGRLIWQSEISNTRSVITPNIESGIYYLRVSTANASAVRKLVKL